MNAYRNKTIIMQISCLSFLKYYNTYFIPGRRQLHCTFSVSDCVMENYIIRSAVLSDNDALMDFYTDDEQETLPPPGYADLKDALQKQSLLTAKKENGIIAAAAGYFEYARSDETHMIYELAGTRVRNNIGRLTGVSLQQILISLRVIQIAATEAGPVSLISSAKSLRSIENLAFLGMEEIVPRPRWFEFDTCSWTRMTERSQWKHLLATERTIDRAIEILNAVNFNKGEFICVASQKQQWVLYQAPRQAHIQIALGSLFSAHLRGPQPRPFQRTFRPSSIVALSESFDPRRIAKPPAVRSRRRHKQNNGS